MAKLREHPDIGKWGKVIAVPIGKPYWKAPPTDGWTKGHRKLGNTGEIVAVYDYTNGLQLYGIEFDFPDENQGCNLEDTLSVERNAYGSWFYSYEVEVIPVPAPPVEEDEEVILRRLSTEAKPALMFQGQFYNLTVVPNADADALMSPLLAKVAERIKAIRQQANNEVLKVKRDLARTFKMPNISQTDVIKGLRLYVEGDNLVWAMPIKFNPKYLGADNKGPTKRISEEHVKACLHDIYIVFRTNREGGIGRVGTYKPDLREPFYHYHGAQDNCNGTVKFIPILTAADAFEMADRYAKLLEIINNGHMRDHNPPGLPSFTEIEFHARDINAADVAWTTREKPVVKLTLKVGDSVVIVKSPSDNFKKSVGQSAVIKAILDPLAGFITVELMCSIHGVLEDVTLAPVHYTVKTPDTEPQAAGFDATVISVDDPAKFGSNVGKVVTIIRIGGTAPMVIWYAGLLNDHTGTVIEHGMRPERFKAVTTTTATPTKVWGIATERLPIQVGDLVQILHIYGGMGQEYVGAIAKVIIATDPDVTDEALVEFVNKTPFGHDGDGRTARGLGYWIPSKYLWARPDRTRRSNEPVAFPDGMPLETMLQMAAKER